MSLPVIPGGPASGELPPARAARLVEVLQVVPGSVVSRTLAKTATATMTLFAFDRGQGLSEHTAPFDAYVEVLEGSVRLTIGGAAVDAAAGEMVRMPAGVPHALHAETALKMLLVMLR